MSCPFLKQIIDSIMALFRVDFSGRGELAERQQKLAQMLSRLQKISEGLCVFVCVLACNDLIYRFESFTLVVPPTYCREIYIREGNVSYRC